MGSAGKEVLTGKLAADAALQGGHYAAKQIFSKDRLVAWSHRRRFEVGVELASRFRGRRVLDYGCGDGTFLALLWAGGARPAAAVGAELDDRQVDDCRTRLAHLDGVAFERIDALDAPAHAGAYDGVICMEVLEHVVAVDEVVDRLWRVLAADGTLIASVPVETGPALLIKQAARQLAAWRGDQGYREYAGYTLREYVAGVFAGDAQHIDRPVYQGELPFHDHKGFNWRALRARLARRFTIDDVIASPIRWLGPALATQVWFVARKKPV